MLTDVHPKLPMRDRILTLDYYLQQLNFSLKGDYNDYIILEKDAIKIHLFSFPELNPLTNYGMIYLESNDIESLYRELLDRKVSIHPNGALEAKPWGQKEFSLLDPDHNLLTFGQAI